MILMYDKGYFTIFFSVSVRTLKRDHFWFPVFSCTWPVVQNVLLSGRLST